MEKAPTMVWKGRITKQGVRDLNYYGPRPEKAAAAAPVTAAVADENIAPEAQPAVTSVIGAPGEDATVK